MQASSVKLYPHQEKAVSEMHNGSVLRGGVGTGKSLTAIAYYVKNETPKTLYVITTAKKRDSLEWEKEAARYAISKTEASKWAGKLIVDSWNNITNYSAITDAFFIFDEQRLVGNGTWVKAFLKIAKNNRWILLSATPGDVWIDYAPVFIANGYYKNRSDFINTHVVYDSFSRFPKIVRYVNTGRLEHYRRKVLVEMPYISHTVRHTVYVPVEFDEALYKRVLKDRWHIFENRPIRDASEMFALLRKVVNTDATRTDAIETLLKKHPRLIVFYNFNYELELLRELSEKIGVPTGEWNGHKHQSIPDTERWLYLVQFTAGAEGWNCVSTDAIAFWSLNYAYRKTEQAKGRIDRLNTPFVDLYCYVLRSKSTLDVAILKALNAKKNFNEAKTSNFWPKTQI